MAPIKLTLAQKVHLKKTGKLKNYLKGLRKKIKKNKIVVTRTGAVIKRDMYARYKAYLKSPEWVQKREQAFIFHGRKCKKCGTESKLQVHHIHYKTLYDEDVRHLAVLCVDCHNKTHGVKKRKHK